MSKILYFTAGANPTEAEANAIAELSKGAEYVCVRNGQLRCERKQFESRFDKVVESCSKAEVVEKKPVEKQTPKTLPAFLTAEKPKQANWEKSK